MTAYQRFVDIALSYVGSHYIWGGKGTLLFRNGQLIKSNITDLEDLTRTVPVFDCSGLVTACLFQVTQGKVDLMGSHSAKTILDTFPIDNMDTDGRLLVFPEHVQIDLGRGRVVEACGGDHTTLTVLDAVQRGAKVLAHMQNRNLNTLLGARRIPLDKSELRAV